MDEFVPIKMPRSRAAAGESAGSPQLHSPFLLIKLHRDLTKVSIKGLLLLLKSQLFLHNFVAFASRLSVTFGVLQVLQANPRVLGVNFVGRIA